MGLGSVLVVCRCELLVAVARLPLMQCEGAEVKLDADNKRWNRLIQLPAVLSSLPCKRTWEGLSRAAVIRPEDQRKLEPKPRADAQWEISGETLNLEVIFIARNRSL